MNILVDTNVFLDYLLNRDEFGEEARTFFRNCYNHRFKTFLTSMSIRDIEYVARKLYKDKDRARAIALGAYSICAKVLSLTSDAAISAIYSNQKDFEDALIIETAKLEDIQLIVTSNIKDFENADFPVVTPREFNQKINTI